jgi:hypothetical protein
LGDFKSPAINRTLPPLQGVKASANCRGFLIPQTMVRKAAQNVSRKSWRGRREKDATYFLINNYCIIKWLHRQLNGGLMAYSIGLTAMVFAAMLGAVYKQLDAASWQILTPHFSRLSAT